MPNSVSTYPEEGVPNDADLVYDGRALPRPPGASPTVLRIYTLLISHPERMTVSGLQDAMKDDWTATDAYRAYEQQLQRKRLTTVATQRAPRMTQSTRNISDYGTEGFKVHAQNWWIRGKLDNMKAAHTARREGTGKEARWYAGEQAPREMVNCPVAVHLRLMNIHDARRHADDHLRRERVKATLLVVLHTRGKKGQVREGVILAYDAVQRAYDYLSGRLVGPAEAEARAERD